MSSLFVPAVALAAIAGCYLGSLFSAPTEIFALILIGASLSLFLFRKHRRIVLVTAAIIALLLGFLRIAADISRQTDALIAEHPGTVSVTGSVISDIEHRKSYSRYTAAVRTINNVPIDQESSILVYEPYPSRCVTGEDVTFSATLIEPEDFVTETGRVFPYRQYLRQFNIHALAFVDGTSCEGSPDQLMLFATLRQKFMHAMHRVLPMQEASLLGGLILGLRGSLSPELLDAFRITGLIHIIVLSGHNVTLVAEATRRLAARAGNRASLIIALITIIAFVLLSGAQTAAIRAGTMAVIALIARSAHREYDGIRALLFVAMIMTLLDPNQALFNISFHLSFLATLGLLLFAPILEHYVRWVPEKMELRGVVVSTIAVQCTLLPYLAYAIGEVSIIGIVANIIILPLVPIAMAAGAAVTIVTLFSSVLGILIMPAAYIPLHTILQTASLLSEVPHATMTLPAFPVLLTAVATVIVIGIGAALHRRHNEHVFDAK
ncbi:MAG: ComEC/Rec2 family competence protein [Candidatus Kaiserbacteria bacterium]|nr:ComEC/Rec2 family competence protein [Candidatus Kaiserbacteria bacterium]